MSNSRAEKTSQAESTSYEAVVFAGIQEAIILDSNGKTALAVSRLVALLGEFPAEPSVHIYLSWYLRRLGLVSQSILHGQKSVELAPQTSFASLALFHALWAAGHCGDAIREARRFISVRKNNARTGHYDEIVSRWDRGDIDVEDLFVQPVQ